LSDQLAEKDVTLAVARVLRAELMARGVNTTLVRDGDVTMSLDQRAAIANSSGAAIYICVHATTQGNQFGLFTAFVPNHGTSHGPFLDWDSAQIRYEQSSQVAETAIATELRTTKLPVRTLAAPLRPLMNITTSALAIEIEPLTGNVSQLTSPEFQRSVAGAIATGVVDIRDKLQGVPK
jgi:N-acetylmuramoyl-L-alanine amidase